MGEMPLEGGKGNVLLPMANKHHGLVGEWEWFGVRGFSGEK